MFMKDGVYDPNIHHHSHLAVGVPGTVAGLFLAWKKHGIASLEASWSSRPSGLPAMDSR